MTSSEQPLIGLRMKQELRFPPPSERCTSLDETSDRVRVLGSQEDAPEYKCRDYLLRRKMENQESGAAAVPDEVDSLCREKMCEWSYRIVDHFNASREIVAIGFSYLDRFIDRCCCDRTAFKLAAMTSMYLATKVFHLREISISSLAELSRGEFDMAHISEMEGIILQTLEWKMMPPTIQCFINELHAFVPLQPGSITRAIYQRATFFAELALFDYSFLTQTRSAIALAAILNAMEGMDENIVSQEDQMTFLDGIREHCGLDHPPQLVDAIRNRLWYVYSQSAQYQDDENPSDNEDADVDGEGDDPMKGDDSFIIGEHSPGSVLDPL